MEVSDLLEKFGYTIEREFRIFCRPYDIFVKELNLLIEFNGTYWHLDLTIYEAEHYDKSTNRYAKDVWDWDEKKNLKQKVVTISL